MSTSSVTPAVQAAATQARLKLIGIAVCDERSPVYGAAPTDVECKEGKISQEFAAGIGKL